MTRRALVSKYATSRGAPVATAVTAFVIFIFDTVAPQTMTFSMFYAAVVLMASSFCKPREVWGVVLGCVGLTLLSYVLSRPPAIELSNTALAIMAMGLTAFLAVRYQSTVQATPDAT